MPWLRNIGYAAGIAAGLWLAPWAGTKAYSHYRWYWPKVPYDTPIGIDYPDVIGNRMRMEGKIGSKKEPVIIDVDLVLDPHRALNALGTATKDNPGPTTVVVSSIKTKEIKRRGVILSSGLMAEEPYAAREEGKLVVHVQSLDYLELRQESLLLQKQENLILVELTELATATLRGNFLG